jgi:nitrilase
MKDEYPRVRVAAVQAASVFLDRERSTAKACDLIREAGRNGAQLIAFPEGFIPAHPIWFHFHAGTGRLATELSVELFKNAVEVPGPEVAELQRAAAEAKAYVVVGACERVANTTGTLYNSQIFLGPDGALLGRRQKLVPTVGERLVHTGGQGDSLGVLGTAFGPVSALICGENSNPLAIFAMTAQYPRIHVMSWPNHFPVIGSYMRERVEIQSKAFAQSSTAFVVSACGTVDEAMIEALQLSPDDAEMIRKPEFCGGSVIVSPSSKIIAGPLGNEEAILYADLNLEMGVKSRLRHDFAGHYNRADIFQLRVNVEKPQIFSVTAGNSDPQVAPQRGIGYSGDFGYQDLTRQIYGVAMAEVEHFGPRELPSGLTFDDSTFGGNRAAGRDAD